jgi:DNA-binding NarL/FixJ family response regulator
LVERLRAVGIVQAVAFSLAHRTLVAVAAGEGDAATAIAAEAHDLMQPLGVPLMSAWADVAYAAALLQAGDAARAERVLAPEGESVPALPGDWPVMALELLTRCRLAAGRLADARRAAARAAAVAAATPTPMATAWSRRAAAEVALAAGDAPGAVEHAWAATAAADGARAPIEAAAARVVAGRGLAAAGDSDAAASELEAAAAAFEARGATRRRDAVEQELRRLGRAVHRRTRRGSEGAGLAALTGRELEVAELVVDRRTNPEIAAELFLSLKTVETHLRNIFRKLGVSSRVELARAIERARRS